MFSKQAVLGAVVCACTILSLGACKKDESKTTLPASWRNPEYADQAFGSFFIIGLGRDDERRRLYETKMAEALEAEGAVAETSWSRFPVEELDKNEVLAFVTSADLDAVVLTQVLGIDEQLRYVEGKTTYVPTSNLDMYMFDYDQNYEVVHEPGYYETDTTYNVETVVYTADKGERVWWVLSETVDPDSVEQVIESVTAATAKRMMADGLIR